MHKKLIFFAALFYTCNQALSYKLCDLCENGDLHKIKHLLETEKIDINKKNKDGWTPLLLAGLKDRKNTIKYLIEQNADVSIKGPNDITLFHYLFQSNTNLGLIKICMKKIEEKKLNKNNFINAKTTQGYTPLIFALETDSFDIINYLLEQRIPIDKTAKKLIKEAPFDHICGLGCLALVKHLVEKTKIKITKKSFNNAYINNQEKIFDFLFNQTFDQKVIEYAAQRRKGSTKIIKSSKNRHSL